MPHRSPRLTSLLLLPAFAILAGCEPELQEEETRAPCVFEEGTSPLYDPRPGAQGGWLSHPFPSDHRVHDGRLDLFDLPNPSDSTMIEDYVFEAENQLDGFGLNTPIYIAFDGPIDTSTIPVAAEAFLDSSAPIQLMDVDPDSPELGRRFPLRWHYYEQGDRFIPPRTLAVAPEWGFPLRSRTRYAVVISDGLLDAFGDPLAAPPLLQLALGDDQQCAHPLPASLVRNTRERLADVEAALDPALAERLKVATVFTTQDATGEIGAMREVIHELPAPHVGQWRTFNDGRHWRRRSFTWAPGETAGYFILEGTFESPYFLEGRIPYITPRDGGSIFKVDGRPSPAVMETLRFALTVPDAPPRAGECHPIVQYAHGTGGNAFGFTGSSAGRMAGRGLAAIGLDQPLHGERNDGVSFDPSLRTFNVANVLATRNVMRQSAADTFSLTRMLKNGFEVPADKSPTGERICFAVDPMLFFGHSQGGITGSMAAAFETDIDAWMLSGSGGGLGITILDREEPIDMRWLLETLGGMDSSESVDELHPLMMLMHMLNEVTDPINYSPSWLAGERPRHFLVTSGTTDDATPYRAALAKTAAAHVPLVTPTETDHPWHDIAGLTPISAPVSGNLQGATAGHIHWSDGDHFVVFRKAEAINASMRFLDSAVDGVPVIEREPGASVR